MKIKIIAVNIVMKRIEGRSRRFIKKGARRVELSLYQARQAAVIEEC